LTVRRLNSLSAQDESEIMDTLNSLKESFEAMKIKELNLSNDEKIKYIYSYVPRSYMSKYVLEEKETFDTLYTKIENDLSKMSFIDNWKNKTRYNDPMEIDYVKKGYSRNINTSKNQNYNYNKNYNKQFKHCDICNMNNHNTNECWYNFKNKNSKYTKLLNEHLSNNKNNRNND